MSRIPRILARSVNTGHRRQTRGQGAAQHCHVTSRVTCPCPGAGLWPAWTLTADGQVRKYKLAGQLSTLLNISAFHAVTVVTGPYHLHKL